MQRYVQICVCTCPTHTRMCSHIHAHTCSRAGVWVQYTRAWCGDTCPAPFSSLAHSCCHLQAHDHTRQTQSLLRNPEKHIIPHTPTMHASLGLAWEGPSADHPKCYISGLSCLPIPVCVSCSNPNIFPVGETNEPQGSPLFHPSMCG